MKQEIRLVAMLWPILTLLTSMCLEARAQSERSEVPASVGSPPHRSAVPPGIDTVSHIKDTIAIQEVQVNTGYQRLPKERSTGSFVQIDNELLNRSISTNILERLDGITSGVVFNHNDVVFGTQIQVRGLSGLQNSRLSPLIVVDNFPFEGDISSI